MKLALLTDAERPSLTADDRRLVPALAEVGIEGVAAVWDDPGVDWATFDAVCVRSPWDYHLRVEAFEAWVRALPVPAFNPAPVLLWNLRKSYLDALATKVAVIPTRRLRGGRLADVLAETGWDEVVVKPEVSAAGHRTWRARAGFEPGEGAWLVQPYLPAIEAEGEWSLVYLDGEYSHAVRKVAAAGNFLIHEEHGGRVLAGEPDAALLAAGARAIGAVGPLPYARVDLVRGPDGPLLMELELVEPELFFRFEPAAAGRLASAIRRRMAGGRA
ncbi:MAG: ATP-grasp domain-containing protein [Myxococcota bacterium]